MGTAMLIWFLLAASTPAPPECHLVPRAVFDAIGTEYSGENAREYTRRLIEYHRIQGSPMMAAVAERVVLAELSRLGIEARIEKFPSDGKISYQTFRSPMGWDMRGGELWVEGEAPERLCRYAEVPMCVSTYSKPGTWAGELVDVGRGTKDADYAGKDVRGKVALASGYAGTVVRQAVLKHGAVGVVIYPAADDRPDHPDLVRYNGIWPRAEELEKTRGGFQISANQYAHLKASMTKGPVRVRGTVDADLGAGELTLVHAWIRGTKQSQREVLLTAHLDHPKWSANDNASGSAGMLELARALQTLIKGGKIPPPERTLHFLWVPEFFGTMAYVTQHPEARRCGAWDDPRKGAPWKEGDPCILANLNLDMIGEDTVKTNSRFYATRTPASVPSFLDALLADVMEQTRAAGPEAPTGTRQYWQPEMIDYAQGSDHDIFLGLGVPSSMFGHDPDWTHHSSEDNLDKVDPSELRRVGTMAGASAWWIASAEPPGALVAKLVEASDLALRSRTSVREALAPKSPPQRSGGPRPRRLVLLPIDSSALEDLPKADKEWWDGQRDRFGRVGEGLATAPDLDLVVYEAVNLMDGQRSTGEIAAALAAEFGAPIDGAWVERVVSVLEGRGLVTAHPDPRAAP